MGNKTSSHPEYTDEWTRNSATSSCERCEAPFGLSNRRHHCRKCGYAVCQNCSSRKTVLGKNSIPKRVCDHCFEHVNMKAAIDAGYGGDMAGQLDALTRKAIERYSAEEYRDARECFDNAKLGNLHPFSI